MEAKKHTGYFMSYTKESLIAALIYSIPNAEFVLESMTIPRAVDEAAVELFRNEDFHSEEAEIIRHAVNDIRSTGQLNYTNL